MPATVWKMKQSLRILSCRIQSLALVRTAKVQPGSVSTHWIRRTKANWRKYFLTSGLSKCVEGNLEAIVWIKWRQVVHFLCFVVRHVWHYTSGFATYASSWSSDIGSS